MNIELLTTGFAIASLAIIVGVLYSLRRRPIVWMLRRADARRARHVAAMTGLADAMVFARETGNAALLDRLTRHHAAHRAALMALDPKYAAVDAVSAPADERRAA